MNLTRTQWNLLANLLGQASNAGLAFLVYPLFVHVLGAEAFGVVGFHISLQAVVTIFDLGIGVAANRELARLSSQPDSANAMRSLVSMLQRVYWLIALLLGGALFMLAPIVAQYWLNPTTLDPAEVASALRWMAVALALQWPTLLYANCISGLQRQSLLNGVQVLASVGRFPGTLLLLMLWSPTLDVYAISHCCVSFTHTFAVMLLLWRILPSRESNDASQTIAWHNLRTFAAGVGSISVLGLILTQYDKVLLSTLLPLDAFGYYAQAYTLVTGFGIVSLPIASAVFPRFSQLVATHAIDELRELYHHSAQLLSALLLPLSVVMMMFPEIVLNVWLGNAVASESLRWLALAMTTYCLMLLPNNLQYAHGQTRMLLWINAIAVITYLPSGYALATWLGGPGAAGAWCAVMLAIFFLGVPLVHRRLMPGDIGRWYLEGIALPLTPVFAINAAALLLDTPTTRSGGAAFLGGMVVAGWTGTLLTVPVTRRWLWSRLQRVL